MDKFEIAMNMLMVAIQKTEQDVVELKDRANASTHPDDKAVYAASAAKVYTKLQGFQALRYDILDMVKDAENEDTNTQEAKLLENLNIQVMTDEVLNSLFLSLMIARPFNVRRVGATHEGKLYVSTGEAEGITVQVLHRGLHKA